MNMLMLYVIVTYTCKFTSAYPVLFGATSESTLHKTPAMGFELPTLLFGDKKIYFATIQLFCCHFPLLPYLPSLPLDLPLSLAYHHIPLLHFLLSLVILGWCDLILCPCVCSTFSDTPMLYDMSYFSTHYSLKQNCIV